MKFITWFISAISGNEFEKSGLINYICRVIFRRNINAIENWIESVLKVFNSCQIVRKFKKVKVEL